MKTQYVIGKGKNAETWTCESRWEECGTLTDFSKAEDIRRLNNTQIEAMKTAGFVVENVQLLAAAV